MLKHIAQTHRKRLIGTFSLVGLENLLMLVYPVFGGRAINAVIAGEVWQALLYALVVLLMWLVGAVRRIADTRTLCLRQMDRAAGSELQPLCRTLYPGNRRQPHAKAYRRKVEPAQTDRFRRMQNPCRTRVD